MRLEDGPESHFLLGVWFLLYSKHDVVNNGNIY